MILQSAPSIFSEITFGNMLSVGTLLVTGGIAFASIRSGIENLKSSYAQMRESNSQAIETIHDELHDLSVRLDEDVKLLFEKLEKKDDVIGVIDGRVIGTEAKLESLRNQCDKNETLGHDNRERIIRLESDIANARRYGLERRKDDQEQ